MKAIAIVLQIVVLLIGVIMITLGLLFWTGNARSLIPLHMLLGVTLVLLLWTTALFGAVVGVNRGLVAVALVWGLITPILGVTQERLLPGSAHWLIQLLHLLVGLVTIRLAEILAIAVRRRSATQPAPTAEGIVQ